MASFLFGKTEKKIYSYIDQMTSYIDAIAHAIAASMDRDWKNERQVKFSAVLDLLYKLQEIVVGCHPQTTYVEVRFQRILECLIRHFEWEASKEKKGNTEESGASRYRRAVNSEREFYEQTTKLVKELRLVMECFYKYRKDYEQKTFGTTDTPFEAKLYERLLEPDTSAASKEDLPAPGKVDTPKNLAKETHRTMACCAYADQATEIVDEMIKEVKGIDATENFANARFRLEFALSCCKKIKWIYEVSMRNDPYDTNYFADRADKAVKYLQFYASRAESDTYNHDTLKKVGYTVLHSYLVDFKNHTDVWQANKLEPQLTMSLQRVGRSLSFYYDYEMI